MSEKQMKKVGWIATFMSVMMYVSYIPQILDNLAGHKGNFIQPAVAALNCCLPIVVANIPGIILGIITALTALI